VAHKSNELPWRNVTSTSPLRSAACASFAR